MSRIRKLAGGAVVAGAAAVVIAERRAARRTDLVVEEVVESAMGETTVVETDDGARIEAVAAGPAGGPVVVLSHGWTNRKEAWAPVFRRLVDSGHRVIAWDQRGHGGSTVGRDELTISRLGDDLLAVLSAYDVHDAVLVGHSMGGMTTMALLGDHPDVVRERAAALVLVATAAYGLSRSARVDAISGRIVGSDRLTRAMAGRFGPRLTRGAVGLDPKPAHLRHMAEMFAGTTAETRLAAFRAMAAMDLRSGLAACPVPAYVLVGSRDQLTRRGLGRQIADAIPGATFVEFEGAGHMLQWERPDDVARIISEAGRRVPAPV